MEEHAAGNGVLDFDDESSGGSPYQSLSRYTRFEYEPLFNQVRTIESGAVQMRPSPADNPVPVPVDVPQSRTDIVFDYQELALSDQPQNASIKPVLDLLKPWGFAWFQTQSSNGLTYDYQAIAKWQLPLAFYDSDLNGDGVLGFTFQGQTVDRGKAVPVLLISGGTRPSATAKRRYAIAWSPNGLPAVVIGPGRASRTFEYYPTRASGASEVVYGEERPPHDSEINIGHAGLLARIQERRFYPGEVLADGPSDIPCQRLGGPYQWLLPATCSADVSSELTKLGLPLTTIQAILSTTSSNAAGDIATTSFSYTELGKARYVWTDTGSTHYVRDIDGRIRKLHDPLNNHATFTYTVQGYLQRSLWQDSSGATLRDAQRDFDDEGRTVYECLAEKVSGCDRSDSGKPTAGVVRQYSYWPEGKLRTSVDPEGLETDYAYNERQLRASERIVPPTSTGAIPRGRLYTYDDDGDVTQATTTDFPPPSVPAMAVNEVFSYDQLRRLKTYTNTRNYAWQLAYSARDLLVKYKRDDAPYTAAPNATPPSWEVNLSYDDFGMPSNRIVNGITTATYQRTISGLPYSYTAAGFGYFYTTYDLVGRPLWSRDPAGNQTVYTWQAHPHISSKGVIRAEHGKTLTIGSWDELNPSELPVKRTVYGAGKEQHWNWTRDGDGFVRCEVNPRSDETLYSLNLLGWPEQVSVQRTRGAAVTYDVSSFQYNGRGEIVTTTDPDNQTTTMGYDPYGFLSTIKFPGPQPIRKSFSYDGLGRPDTEFTGTATIKHHYDDRGDPTWDSVVGSSAEIVLGDRSFDDLGRVILADNFNVGLSSLPPADRTVEEFLTYDQLGRVEADGTIIGSHTPTGALSQWTIVRNRWQRDILFPKIDSWSETYDSSGRIQYKERTSGLNSYASFEWLGNLYEGRAQGPGLGVFRERRSFDPFGLPLEWRFTGIDLDSNQQPVNPDAGRVYCGGDWDVSQCSSPLLAIDGLREIRGKIASLQWAFGHPVFENGDRVPFTHPRPWRGYVYSPRGQLGTVWENAGDVSPVSTRGLQTNNVSDSQIAQLGTNSDPWEYHRENAVGSTTRIEDHSTKLDRWNLPVPRNAGYQISELTFDHQTSRISYDGSGRVEAAGDSQLEYDPGGRLVGFGTKGEKLESYVYDPSGRLAAVLVGPGLTLDQSFTYDGQQIVAARNGNDELSWTAVWGPNIDQLIEWTDAAGHDYVPLTDNRNSVVGAWDRNALRMVETANYNPEGRLEVSSPDGKVECKAEGTGAICPAPGNIPFGLFSALRPSKSGLVYLRNRWYSTELGQFISPDPLGYGDSFNPYAYSNFDPINGWDPSGMSSGGPASGGPTQPAPNLSQPQQRSSFRKGISDVIDSLGKSLGLSDSLPDYGIHPIPEDVKTRGGGPRGLQQNKPLPVFQWQPPPSDFDLQWNEFKRALYAIAKGLGLYYDVAAKVTAPAAVVSGIMPLLEDIGPPALDVTISEASPSVDVGISAETSETAEMSAGASTSASAGAVTPGRLNTINHIFGKESHNLGPLVQQLGGAEAAFAALEEATAEQVASKGITAGIFEEIVNVGGMDITVRGAVVNGVTRVSTAFR